MVLLNPIQVLLFFAHIKLTFHYGAIEPDSVGSKVDAVKELTFHYGAIESSPLRQISISEARPTKFLPAYRQKLCP